MRKLSISFYLIFMVLVLMAPTFLPGCTSSKGEGFAIYLTRNDIAPAQLQALSHFELSTQPLFSSQDIITYNAQTHELELTVAAFERISHLEVPVRGKSFVVCVDKSPVYAGAFWTPISSMSFDGVTIWKPLGPQQSQVVTLELGYPSAAFYGGEDPRNNPLVLNSLKQAGKLVDQLTLNDVKALPRSMKGYELYSWQQDGLWHFTLITGTNRNKTWEEIISQGDYVSSSGWVKVSVASVGALETALSKLPAGESVFWLSGLRDPAGNSSPQIQLPPENITTEIQKFALSHNLDFHISGVPST